MRQASATMSGMSSSRTDAPAFAAARAAACSASAPAASGCTGKLLRHDTDARAARAGASNSGRLVIADNAKRDALDVGREQPDGIERPGKGFDADGRQQPIGRLDRGSAAKRGRPDRPSRRSACRSPAGSCRRRPPPPNLTTTRPASRKIVRIARRRRIEGGKRGGRGLAGDGRAGRLQRHHDRRVGARLLATIDLRTHLGRQVGGVDDVLDADRDAAQRTFVFARAEFARWRSADGRSGRRWRRATRASAASGDSSPCRCGASGRRARSWSPFAVSVR